MAENITYHNKNRKLQKTNVMGNSLMIYLNQRMEEEKNPHIKNLSSAGPVITISREVGCNGLKIAHQIAERLNKRKMINDWKVLSKEIFFQSAKELNLDPKKIQRIFKQTDKYTFEEILKAFSDKQYKSERKIVKTTYDVVRSFAVNGFSIIVGRAGHIIAQDIKNSLHIRLVAPFEFRIQTIMENNKLTRNEAIHFIHQVEKERIAFRDAICDKKVIEENFDITVNRSSFATEDIVDIIEYAVDRKKIMEAYKQKIEYY